jgi:hypothetical protein
MRTVTEYRKHAEKRWELANFTTEPTNKEILERLAETWEKLADLRERDRDTPPADQMSCSEGKYFCAGDHTQ